MGKANSQHRKQRATRPKHAKGDNALKPIG